MGTYGGYIGAVGVPIGAKEHLRRVYSVEFGGLRGLYRAFGGYMAPFYYRNGILRGSSGLYRAHLTIPGRHLAAYDTSSDGFSALSGQFER